jgi:hypothetical protein
MLSVFLVLCSVAAQRSDTPTAESLRRDVARWSEEVSFRCTFRLRSGVANSTAEALRGEVDSKLGSPYSRWECRGEFQKLGQKMRCAIDFGSPGYRYGPARGEITLEPVEEATNGLVAARRFPRRSEIDGENAKVAIVQLRVKLQGQALLAGAMSQPTMLPLIPVRSTAEQPFEALQVDDVRAIDAEHVEVLCTGRQQGRNRRTDYVETRKRRIIFWTKPVPPVVERIEEHDERTSLEGPARLLGRDEIHAILSDFKPCPGGMVARRVRYVEQSEGLRARRWKLEEPGVRVLEWSSDDLGDQPPTNADFVMSIPSDVRLVGLKQGLPSGTERTLDLNKIGPSDVEEPVTTPTPREPPFLHTGLGKLLVSWVVEVIVFGCVLARHLSNRAIAHDLRLRVRIASPEKTAADRITSQ